MTLSLLLPTTLLLSSLATVVVSAQATTTCDYYTDNNCLKPDATASTTIPFSPLFSTPPTFVYAIDELSETDKKILREKDSNSIPPSTTYNGVLLQVSWWLEYDNATVNFDSKQNRLYYAFAMETNSSNAIGGGERGCGGLLGEQCIANLKDVIKVRTYKAPQLSAGLGNVLDELTTRPLRNLSCPEDIFGVTSTSQAQTGSLSLNYADLQKPLWLPLFASFAKMTEDGYRPPPPPGNSTSVYSPPQLRLRSLEQQKARGIIAVTVGWPAGSPRNSANYTLDDVTVEMSCLRIGSSAGSGSGGNSAGSNGAGGQGKNGGSRAVRSGSGLVLGAAVGLALAQVVL